MTVFELPQTAMEPAQMLADLRFTLEPDAIGAYRFRAVRLRNRSAAPEIQDSLVHLLEGHSVAEALLALEEAAALNGTQKSIREFLHNLEHLLPSQPGRLPPQESDPLAANDSCRNCLKHRMADLRRRNTGGATHADQCECLRDFRLRSAQRDAINLTLHKVAV